MKIIVDKEGKEAIEKVCDVALKSLGNRILPLISEVYSAMELEPKDSVKGPIKVTTDIT